MTIQDVAEKYNVDKAVAYGLLKFLELKGFVVANGTKRTPGVKGKGSKLYQWSDSAAADFANLVKTLSL
jgi:DNA-binding PadR family transcriptional regulator